MLLESLKKLSFERTFPLYEESILLKRENPENSTYNGVLELFNELFVSPDLIVALVGRDLRHAYGDRAVCLLEGDVDLLVEFLHVHARVDTLLHQGQVHVPDHRLQILQTLLRLVFFHILYISIFSTYYGVKLTWKI